MKDWHRVEEAIAAIEDVPSTERAAWLASYCNGDDVLRDEILSLLEFEKPADNFLDQDIAAYAAVLIGDGAATGKAIGNYRIIGELGQGGMGAVYLAERIEGDFDQQVALKIIRQSFPDARMTERFRLERQILASLNHPNIASLLDGGVSPGGEPFLAMELVDGEPITTYIAKNQLGIDEIIRLLIKVCNAVAYAHRNLVIHRDIKPGNILVTADGEPKLLDFGLAKLVGEDLGAADQTETLYRALTPAYASPEQLRGDVITTASDIYSLGVLFYELLTGRRPFDTEKKTVDSMLVAVSTQEPKAPSVVSGSSLLRGDLDNILLMSLRTEPERRYSSVGEFADDLDRHLRKLPVAARPHTVRYRSARFVRRHRAGVAAAAAIFISLVTAAGISLYQAQAARLEKDKAEAVSQFLQTMLNASSPNNALKQKSNNLTVKDLLDDASRRLASDQLGGQPEVKAQLQQIIGTSYLSIGEYDLADQNLSAAHEANVRLYGKNSEEAIKTLVLLASLWSSRGDIKQAESYYENLISTLRSGGSGGSEMDLYFVQALYDYALTVRARGDSKTAEKLLREAIDVAARRDFDKSGTVGSIEPVLALTLADTGKFEEAEAIASKSLQALRASGKGDSPELAVAYTGLGMFQMEQGKHVEARANLTAAEAIYHKLFTPTFLALGDNLRLQAQNNYFSEDYTAAELRINEALKIYNAGTSTAYVNYAGALMIQGLIFSKTGRLTQAEATLREALRIRTENLPKEHYLTEMTKGALGECLARAGKLDEAQPLLRESYDYFLRTHGEANPRTKLAAYRLQVGH